MPIYEYRCEACGKRTSALLRTFSEPDPACPHCGKQELKRLVSTFATARSEGDTDFGGDFDEGMGAGGEDDDFGGDYGGDYGGLDDDF